MNKDEIKKQALELLKPNILKIVLFAVLMIGLNLFIAPMLFGAVDAVVLVGIPLPFLPVGSFGLIPNNFSGTLPTVEFSIPNFIIDLIFWYVISAAIILAFEKTKKK